MDPLFHLRRHRARLPGSRASPFVWGMTNTTDRATAEIVAPDNQSTSRAPYHHEPRQEFRRPEMSVSGIIALGQGLEFLTELHPSRDL